MIIVIDGYNVLKQIAPAELVSERERNQFIAVLGRYAKRKKHKLVVVFDGGPYEWAHKEPVHGVCVVYSGIHESADEYIVHYLEERKTRDILLISSDHELCLRASEFAIPSLGSGDFYTLVQEALRKKDEQRAMQQKEKAVKITQAKNAELDALMIEASQHVPIKREDLTSADKQQVRPSYRVSKKERKLLAKLKKL